jgi:hypothetical protein
VLDVHETALAGRSQVIAAAIGGSAPLAECINSASDKRILSSSKFVEAVDEISDELYASRGRDHT